MTHNKVPYRLRSCVWEITLACCFSCRYCGSRAGKAREHELTTEEALDVAGQLADMGCRRVSLIGGEVFMRPDWSVILKALTDRGVKVPVITNGYLFSDRLLEELIRCKVESVAISVDGPERIHDVCRQDGSFKRAMKAMEALTGRGIPVSVITTLHSGNISCLEEMYNILIKYDIFAWQLQACSPMGYASRSEGEVSLEEGAASRRQADHFRNPFSTEIDFGIPIEFVENHLNNPHFRIGIADNIGYYTDGEGKLRGNPGGQAVYRGCLAGLCAIGIDSVGNVRGCESMYDDRFIEGNLREKSLYEIWNDPCAFSYNRQFRPELLTGRCRTCEYGRACAGGCRSYNYFTHGKLYESLRCARMGSDPIT